MLGFARTLAVLVGIASCGATTVAAGQAQPPSKSAPGRASAKKQGKRSAEVPPKVDLDALRRELESGDEGKLLAGLDQAQAAEAQAADVAPLVDALLRRGATVKVCGRALEVAGALKHRSSSAAIAPYVRHRDSGLRRSAVLALVRTGGDDAVKALRQALRSSDGGIRSAAASGLGALGATDAVPDLVQALDRHVAEAAAALGQLCSEARCNELTTRLGKAPFDVVTAGLEQVLFRPPEQISDQHKLQTIARLRELQTSEARRFLRSVLERWPTDGSATVRAALASAARGDGG